MDPLTELVAATRAASAFLLRVVMRPPWAIEVVDEAPLSVVPVLSGRMWLRPTGADARLLRAGDVLVVRTPTTYVLSTEPDTPPKITIGSGQQCSGADGRDLASALSTGVRTWGNDPDGSDQLLVGSYRTEGEVGRLVLGALPPYAVAHDPSADIIRLLSDELARESPGGQVVLDRLLDTLLVAALRAWLRDEDPATASWLIARRDPVVRRALDALHSRPGEAWTVQRLAAEAGVSRAAMSRRFHDAVGSPPMAYLSTWRLAIGADLLRSGADTLATIARRVGYADEFTFSKAFKSAYGASPREFRSTH